jgi:hypothetical protein
MALSTNLSALTTNLGAYYRDNKDMLVTSLLLGLFDPNNPNNINDRISLMDGVTDEVPMPKLAVADIVKPANSASFSATSNALVWTNRTLKVRRFKADLQIIPEEYEKTFLAYKKTPGSLNEKKMIFEEYIVTEVIKRANENVRKALFQGTYNSGGTAVNDIVSGVKTLLDAEVTATTLTPTTLVAPTTSNVITQIEDVFDDLGEPYKMAQDLVCILPTAWYTTLVRANRSTLGRNSVYGSDQLTLDGYSNCKIVHEPYLTGNRVIITPKSNIVVGVDTTDEYNNIRFQEFERTIKMMVDGKIGIDFKDITDSNRPLAYGKD